MEKETGELVVVNAETGVAPTNLGMLQANSPEEMMAAASKIATPLKAFIKERGLSVSLGGDMPHVFVEGWTTMLMMLGVMAQEISVTEVSVDVEGFGPKYVAKMALVRISDQAVITSASAECGGVDERDWHFRPKYKYVKRPDGGKDRVPDGETPVPGNQRRSMAITRATGKAARIGFSWIMDMAGYSPMPAEEASQADKDDAENPDPTQRPNPNEGNDPRDLMNKNKRPEKGQIDTGVKQMKAKVKAPCEICKGEIVAGSDIAFKHDEKGGTHVAHWNCFQDTENAREGN